MMTTRSAAGDASAPCGGTARRAAPMAPDERRAAIITAVLPLLVEEGAVVTTRRLAEAAGVSEGTLFNVFDGKDALIRAAVDAAVDPDPFEQAVDAISADAPWRERLTAATVLIQRRIVDIWKLVALTDPGEHHRAGKRPMPDSPALVALFESGRDRLRMPPVEAARLLRSMTFALTHPLLAVEPATAADIVDVFLDGVGA